LSWMYQSATLLAAHFRTLDVHVSPVGYLGVGRTFLGLAAILLIIAAG